MLDSSSATRSAITRFSLQVWTNSRYFCRFSKKRKLPRGIALLGRHFEAARRRQPARRGGRDIGLDAVQRVDGDALALAQAVHQLAVIDGPAAEGRFRHVGVAAEFGDLAQNLVVFHGKRIGTLVGGSGSSGLSYHPLPNRQNGPYPPGGMNPAAALGNKTARLSSRFAGLLMRQFVLLLSVLASALWPAPSPAQQRNQLGPLCTTDTTPADQQIDACNKIIALKVFTGEKLATIYFWRAVGWNKKGNYTQVIADATEAIRLAARTSPSYNLRGSAYYDKGEYDIAIADFNDALRMGSTSGIIYHNRGNAWRGKGEYAKAIADYDSRSRLIRSRRSPIRTAAPRNRRSAISTARSPTSTRRSASTPRCRSR